MRFKDLPGNRILKILLRKTNSTISFSFSWSPLELPAGDKTAAEAPGIPGLRQSQPPGCTATLTQLGTWVFVGAGCSLTGDRSGASENQIGALSLKELHVSL